MERLDTKYCFRCGEWAEDAQEELIKCSACGEKGLYTTLEMMDLLNDLYIKRRFTIHKRGEEDNT